MTKYEVSLLSPKNITIKRCTKLNPATLFPQESKEGREQDSDTKTDDEELGSDSEEPTSHTHKKGFLHIMIAWSL